MRRRYLRFKKRALLKMIYALAAVLQFLNKQCRVVRLRAYRRATLAAGDPTMRYARRIPRTGTEQPNGQVRLRAVLHDPHHIEQIRATIYREKYTSGAA